METSTQSASCWHFTIQHNAISEWPDSPTHGLLFKLSRKQSQGLLSCTASFGTVMQWFAYVKQCSKSYLGPPFFQPWALSWPFSRWECLRTVYISPYASSVLWSSLVSLGKAVTAPWLHLPENLEPLFSRTLAAALKFLPIPTPAWMGFLPSSSSLTSSCLTLTFASY